MVVIIKGSLRHLDQSVRQQVTCEMNHLAKRVASAHGCKAKVSIDEGY